RNILAGRSGVAPIASFDASGFPVRIAAEVKGFDAEAQIEAKRLLKFCNRSHRFALAAAEEAMRDAGIAPTSDTADRWGCVVGTGMMGIEFRELESLSRTSAPDGELHADAILGDDGANDPMVFCRSQSTAGVSLLTRRFDIHGYATSVHTACASGGQ